MAILKQCKSKGCKSSPRCDHPWWFDVMYQRRRYRMPVDAFALKRGATESIRSKQEAEKVWEAARSSTRRAHSLIVLKAVTLVLPVSATNLPASDEQERV